MGEFVSVTLTQNQAAAQITNTIAVANQLRHVCLKALKTAPAVGILRVFKPPTPGDAGVVTRGMDSVGGGLCVQKQCKFRPALLLLKIYSYKK